MTGKDTARARADEAYRLYLRHLDVCQACHSPDECDEGTRMRRAIRAARALASGKAPSCGT